MVASLQAKLTVAVLARSQVLLRSIPYINTKTARKTWADFVNMIELRRLIACILFPMISR